MVPMHHSTQRSRRVSYYIHSGRRCTTNFVQYLLLAWVRCRLLPRWRTCETVSCVSIMDVSCERPHVHGRHGPRALTECQGSCPRGCTRWWVPPQRRTVTRRTRQRSRPRRAPHRRWRPSRTGRGWGLCDTPTCTHTERPVVRLRHVQGHGGRPQQVGRTALTSVDGGGGAGGPSVASGAAHTAPGPGTPSTG
jgi:hypothetical protein